MHHEYCVTGVHLQFISTVSVCVWGGYRHEPPTGNAQCMLSYCFESCAVHSYLDVGINSSLPQYMHWEWLFIVLRAV